MLKAIIFDLDETLVDREATMRRFLIEQHGRFRTSLNCERVAFAETVLRYQQGGYADKRSAYHSALRDLTQDLTLLDGIVTDFEAKYGTEAIAFEGVRDTIKTLGDNYAIGLISNGRSEGQRNKLRSTGLSGLFDAVVISEEAGMKKPDPRIFVSCLEMLSVNPDEAVYVGDSPVNDIEPAITLGMKAVWLINDRFDAPLEVDAAISKISELPEALAQLC